MKIGILGGTFDPIHYGHLWFAEYAREKFKLDKVFFIPNRVPSHREIPIATSKQRYEMVLLATLNNPYFEVLPIELEREGVSYMVDTIRDLSTYFSNAELYLLLGNDAFRDFLKWKDPYKIVEKVSIIVGSRGEEYYTNDLKDFIKTFENKIFFLDFPYYPISAKEIRDRVKKGLSIKYLVPENVEEYIIKNSVYCEEDQKDVK
ncbi:MULTISPECIES: nicotinate-nucleotide adenylyltransferase [Dictyoglomus]|uniref:Probable nicotinate-nucleotide adenylyltransferase n=1 Tax=Dictyoglomus turgidum (strain DSM 6724 / Z-1310) TaxID=515635 RepID=NADD_DICTD|nr:MULTISPECIES: nicotinate-nucleotide adenylyltransferase [Dictyoglomus]B8E0B1.1 RecName: Full=Probable nicotinate-nucleotide adenylyltransferase; AltName: Full=Deamido-NAD(+) diphosphorylase; AltName: Full=Deamido-NAD(+) pyrophosphorylase; AltName: Full=Nicotinate mononucleotide adenylyltransferase; Short=NaMN adenylyltransferase [Dictyoglomus turgidum DSM 6724]ACK42556.1 nicotinate (nicotinamide) nucleotide adenylyltransferase [Dictyoglomus turgidum DSM 6724]HBU32240.1 nicotinate-nicotinamide